MARVKATHAMSIVVVNGSGRFPIDMLRYDQCCPDSQNDAWKIDAGPNWDANRNVTLRMYTRPGGGTATRERWQSFGWRVVEEKLGGLE